MNKGVNTIPSPGRHARKSRFVSVVVAGMVAGPLLQSANASPVVTLTVTPLSVPAGQNAVLSWSSTGAATCSASDAWTGARQTSGHALTAPTTPGSYVYSLSCTTNGVQVTATATLTVTEIGYFPAVAGLPVSCPLGLNARPGGREPVSVQLRGGEPPEARNV